MNAITARVTVCSRFFGSMKNKLSLLLLIWPVQLLAATLTGWIGTYTTLNGTSTGSSGIYAFQWDAEQGVMSAVHPVAATTNPSFLALHPSGRFLYAVNEDASSSGTDHLTAFAIDSSARLQAIGTVSSQGLAPCHLAVDPSGHWLFVANYVSGTIAVYPIRPDGRLGQASQVIQQKGSGPFADRQKSAHAHEVVLSPDGRFLLSADLGADRIFVYRFEATSGALTPNSESGVALPAGYGPRHLVFSKDGRTIYLLTELTPAVITLRWNAQQGSMSQLGITSTLPATDPVEPGAAEIVLHPNGKFLYASNRGHSNTIAIFHVGSEGLLAPAGHVSSNGKLPRFFTIDSSGKFLIAANEGSGNLVTFAIDPSSGALTRVGADVTVPAPVSLVFAHAPVH
jgi:6-phosphogluconolactonase